MSYNVMENMLENNEDFARGLIKADFYIKNVLETYYN